MINNIIGGAIALTSGIIIGTLTPSINLRIQKRNIFKQKFLQLISILFLIKNNLTNYLYQHICIDSLGEYEIGEEEVNKLRMIKRKIETNIEVLYQIQQELILSFKSENSTISIIYKKTDELENFIWKQNLP